MTSAAVPRPAPSDRYPAPAGRTPPDLASWVGFRSIFGTGGATLWALIRGFGDLSLAWRAGRAELVAAGVPESSALAIVEGRPALDPDRVLRAVEALGAQAVAWDDPAYPSQLREIPDPPPLLFVRGDVRVAAFERSVAMVGTRRMSPYGRQVTEAIAHGLAQRGLCVVSGMAAGIDSVAHRAALAAGGPTVAVWGTGLDDVFPPENARLAQEIARTGAVVTEYPLGMLAAKENFPQRNRLISGLARGVVVVEAPLQSGALITARYAIEQNREVMAVPGDVFAVGCQGTNALLFRGEARAVACADEVLIALGFDLQPQQLAMLPPVAPTDEEAALLRLLTATPTHVDALCRALGLPVHRVAAVLTMMEVRGLARHMGGGTYVAPAAARGGT
ncbi:MAG: DNA-protecting protein DprA [Actinobacteria bacterium]|nr:DNA-protecting protein DprA [Actinomycetota bacterium]